MWFALQQGVRGPHPVLFAERPALCKGHELGRPGLVRTRSVTTPAGPLIVAGSLREVPLELEDRPLDEIALWASRNRKVAGVPVAVIGFEGDPP